MPKSRFVHRGLHLLLAVALVSSVSAEWKAANPETAVAANDPKIAAVLEAVNRMDEALVKDDHAAFQRLLAADLVVNNPQNTVSQSGATAQRNAVGRISYSSYLRTIEYAGMRGDMVLLMGGEVVVPKGDQSKSAAPVHRRFTDLWRKDGERWVLAVRQSTVIASQ